MDRRFMTGAGQHEPPPPPEYVSALGYLAQFVDLERRGMGAAPLGLARIRELLAGLRDPQRRYRSILIAGTKGKGSTAAMLERALRAAGYRTGLYSQPHLHTIRERVQLDGEPVSPADFAATFAEVRQAVERDALAEATTAYEVMTALTLLQFARANVDVAVLEVGLGGRLDATNVVDADISVLTSISLDHVAILGPTVAAIAGEKADIIKPGRPIVSAPQPADAMAVIRRVAADRASPLTIAMENGARWVACGSRWDLHTTRGVLADVRPALRGAHQRLNASVAATVLDTLAAGGTFDVPLDAVRVGIERVVWPGRFEVLGSTPSIVVDGAHNVESAVRLREALVDELGPRQPIFVLGIASDKDVPGIVAALCGRAAYGEEARPFVIATHANHPRATDPADIADLAARAGAQVRVAPTVAAAIADARALAGPADVIVVTGSLYTVAEAREALGLAEHEAEPPFNPWAAR
jgi:dihydrofolate synthase / folylpolyglutamate synthase